MRLSVAARLRRYVTRMINLGVLVPEIATAMLDETLPPDVTLLDLVVEPAGAVGGAARASRDATLANAVPQAQNVAPPRKSAIAR